MAHQDELSSILGEVRADIAAGRKPDAAVLERRLREASADDAARRRALQQLRRLLAVHRARGLVRREPAAPAAPAVTRPRRAALRAKPTITGNMDIRREGDGVRLTLRWDPAARVSGWQVRISERSNGARPEYAVREELTLPESATSVELELSEQPVRVHVLGRSRDGRLLRRAIVSGLTVDSWRERWQRRASAS